MQPERPFDAGETEERNETEKTEEEIAASLFDEPITTVCLTGHRSLPAGQETAIAALLDDILFSLYDRGARIFKTGGAVGFDTLAAEAVLRLKERFGAGAIHLYLCLPAPTQTTRYSAAQKQTYDRILAASDGLTYASDVCTTESYYARNRALVAGSDVCVAYCTRQRGGSYYTCRQALAHGLEFINLADFLPTP